MKLYTVRLFLMLPGLYLITALVGLFLLPLFSGCQTKPSSHARSSSDTEILELKAYETFVAVEDEILAVPSIIKHDNNFALFVYDKSKGIVAELDDNGNVVREYGRRGRGPGEFLRVNNLFVKGDSLYVVDILQYVIHKYGRNSGLISSLDYGRVASLGRPNTPSAPFSPSIPRAENIDNQPFVTSQGHVLISSTRFRQTVPAVYELRDWKGNYISDIGKIPEGSSFVIDYDQLRSDVSNREVPAFYRSNAFPVQDPVHPAEYFLIYSAFPKVTKYKAGGEQLWETNVAGIPEIDSITTRFYDIMERMQQADRRSRIGLRYYVAGAGSPAGELWLAADSNPLWIHRFNSTGKLTHRYRLVSEDVDLLPIFDIDFTGRRIFVVTEEAEIRTYSF